MHQSFGDARPLSARSSAASWQGAWPWLVALLPWAILINYLRLEWSANEQYGYGFVVPFLSLYLWLQLWPTRPEPKPIRHSGFLFAATFFLAALVGPLLLLIEASPEWRLIGWILALATTGLTSACVVYRGGWPWLRHFAFPLFFIFAAVPWPTSLEFKIMIPMMQADAATAVEILNWWGIPAIQHQNVIQLPNGVVGVDEACSGIRSLQTSLMIALFAGEWMQLRLLRRGVLLVAALLLTYGFNLLRTLILVSLSANWDSAMLHRWHDTVGLGVLLLSLGGLWLLAGFIHEPALPAAAPPSAPAILPAADWPRSAMALVGLWLVVIFIGTQAWFDWHEARALPPERWAVNWPIHSPTYEAVEIPVETRTSLMYDPDQSSAAKWQAQNAPSLWLGYFLRWKPGRETSILASNHHPDVCLPATGKPLVADDGLMHFPAAGLNLPVQVYQFNDGGQPLFVFYCVWVDGHPEKSEAAPAHPTVTSASGWLATLRHLFLPFTPAASLDARLQAIAAGERNRGQQVFELGLWGDTNLVEAKKDFAQELAQLVTRTP